MSRQRDLPIAGGVLVSINVISYIVCLFSGGELYSWGSLNIYGVLVRHEYGRVLWAMFLHSGTAHLFSNMLILFFMGAMIEKEVGHICYLLLQEP